MANARTYKRHYAGERVGKLTLVERMPGGQKWRCVCDCGAEVITQASNGSKACKKCAYEELAISRTKHGESPAAEKSASRLYRIWLGIRTRCNNPQNHSYNGYGSRGISVCEEWDDYIVFRDWALANGYSDELEIDRIDNNGGYSPDNCRWVTRKEQMRNTHVNHIITIDGKSMCVIDWCKELNLYKGNVYTKAKRIGITPDDYIRFKYFNRNAVCTKRAYNRFVDKGETNA